MKKNNTNALMKNTNFSIKLKVKNNIDYKTLIDNTNAFVKLKD